MWPFGKRPAKLPDVDTTRIIVESASKLLASSFEAQARVAEKRAETEVERLKLEQEDRHQLREWRAERREKNREAGRRGARKTNQGYKGGCQICDDPTKQFTIAQWNVHLTHVGSAPLAKPEAVH